ncbi:MAG TPA: hypothetical protein VFR08_00690 [Candidatus Angelobacter sp.]|nr:hypothetical protein [Candidatus Angelobacter sp.]
MDQDNSPRRDIDALVNHLKELTEELTAVHSELYWLAMRAQDSTDKESPAELKVDLLTDLKGAVDNMRLMLWNYIETASVVDPQGVREGIEHQRVRRVTEFLELLRDRLGHNDEEPVSFIERISASVNNRLQKTRVA